MAHFKSNVDVFSARSNPHGYKLDLRLNPAKERRLSSLNVQLEFPHNLSQEHQKTVALDSESYDQSTIHKHTEINQFCTKRNVQFWDCAFEPFNLPAFSKV